MPAATDAEEEGRSPRFLDLARHWRAFSCTKAAVMGQKLVDYYDRAGGIGGHLGKFRLAVLTRMTSTQALTEPDSAQNLETFERAWLALQDELARGDGGTRISRSFGPRETAARDSADSLRQHIEVFLALMSQRSLFLSSLGETLKRITEAAANTLQVARASVWFIEDEGAAIRCVDLFEVAAAQHSNGTVLFATDFPAYFKAMLQERTIAAHDAHTDPRTSVFSEPYLTPLGIGAMLDVPIWANGAMAGVVCHEHIGGARTWTQDEENFAYLMSHFVALALERERREKR